MWSFHPISKLGLNNIVAIVLLLLISLSFASIHEDEGRINSEGMWQEKTAQAVETKVSTGHGNSRFDVGGLLTAAGLKTGGSLFGLVVFPFLFPIFVLFSIALFIISLSVGAPIAAGRRFDNNGNDATSSSSYDILPDLANTVLGSEQCVERIGCEILDGMGHKTKILFRLLRKLNLFFPAESTMMEKVDIAVTPGTGRRSCSSRFKCDSARV